MNYGPLIFIGIFITFFSAWVGLVFAPAHQFKDIQPAVVEGSAVTNPRPYSGQELRGREVYTTEGCVYCHSQQIRAGNYQNDIERGWGPRRSDPRDYVYDYPVLLGTMRTGPDLVNIGARQPSAVWHHQHLYDPQLITRNSLMSPFSYLYEKRKIVGAASPEAIRFDYAYVTLDGGVSDPEAMLKEAGFRAADKRWGRWIVAADEAGLAKLRGLSGVSAAVPYVEPGYEIVPTRRAIDLVEYLRSMDRTYELPPLGESVPKPVPEAAP